MNIYIITRTDYLVILIVCILYAYIFILYLELILFLLPFWTCLWKYFSLTPVWKTAEWIQCVQVVSVAFNLKVSSTTVYLDLWRAVCVSVLCVCVSVLTASVYCLCASVYCLSVYCVRQCTVCVHQSGLCWGGGGSNLNLDFPLGSQGKPAEAVTLPGPQIIDLTKDQ